MHIVAVVHVTFQTYLGIDKENKSKHFPGNSEFAGFAVERWLPLISIIWRRYPQSRLSLCRNMSSHSSMRGLSVCVWNKRSVPYPVRYIRGLSSVSSHAAWRTKRKNSRPVLDVQAFTDRVSRFYRSNTCLQSQYDTVWWDVSVNAYVSWHEPWKWKLHFRLFLEHRACRKSYNNFISKISRVMGSNLFYIDHAILSCDQTERLWYALCLEIAKFSILPNNSRSKFSTHFRKKYYRIHTVQCRSSYKGNIDMLASRDTQLESENKAR